MGKPLSRQVEPDTDRDAAQRRMDRVESIRALVQVLDVSSDMARFVESMRADFVCQRMRVIAIRIKSATARAT
jgi:hypothetical protein